MFYKGYYIFKADKNSSGIRYYARTSIGIVRADTLRGIRQILTQREGV